MARNDPQVNVRLPAELKSELDESSAAEGRSLTAEIVTRLEWSFQAQLLDHVQLLHTNLGDIRMLADDLEALQNDIASYESGETDALDWLTGSNGALDTDIALKAARLACETIVERVEALRSSIGNTYQAIEENGREPAYYRRKFPKAT